jgi:hypothetical protein
MKKNPIQKSLKIKSILVAQSYLHDKRILFLGYTSSTKDWNLVKISAS